MGIDDRRSIMKLHIPNSGVKRVNRQEVFRNGKMVIEEEVEKVYMTENEIDLQAPIMDWRSLLSQ